MTTPFRTAIAEAIRANVKQLRSEGTTGMSPDNLLQVTPTPSASLAGAPIGTNAGFVYRQTFREVLAILRLPGFQILQ